MENIVLHVFSFSCFIAAFCVNGCCFPKQTEGQMGLSIGTVENGKGTAISGLLYYAEDLDRKLMYQSGTVYVNGYPIKGSSLYDYNTGKKYETAFGGCQVKDIKNQQLKCIPNNARKVIDSYYGVPENKIDVESYWYLQDKTQITTTVVKGTCTVIGYSMQNGNMILNAGFLGVTLGLKNATVLEIPPECRHLQP